MTDSDEQQSQQPPATKDYVELSPEAFQRLLTTRYRYLMMYAIVFFGWVLTRVLEWRGVAVPNVAGYGVMACQILFMFQFTKVLRGIGYPIWFAVGACVLTFVPVPGLLFLALADRQIAKVLDTARGITRGPTE